MADRGRAEQLSLAIDDTAVGTLPRLRPMLATPGAAPFDDPDWFFEPWWPGASALAYVEGGAVHLQIGHMADPLEAFPELSILAGQLRTDRVIAEGTLLVLDEEGRPDGDLLRRRLAEPSTRTGAPAFVASDLIYRDGRALFGLPFEERRAQLSRVLTDGDTCVLSRGLRGEGLTLADAVASMGLNAISAREMSGRYRPGVQDDAWLRVPVTEAPVEPVRPFLALLQRLPLDG